MVAPDILGFLVPLIERTRFSSSEIPWGIDVLGSVLEIRAEVSCGFESFVRPSELDTSIKC